MLAECVAEAEAGLAAWRVTVRWVSSILSLVRVTLAWRATVLSRVQPLA